jgi:hypothetical protein
MSEPTLAGHVEFPVAFGSEREVEELLTRLGPHAGLLIDTEQIRQSQGSAADLRSRRRAVCYVLDEADWYIATGQVSEYGGMICFARG